jgi:hypothetical protein
MGYFTVFLQVGLDHRFVTKEKPTPRAIRWAMTPTIFRAYFGKGFRWHYPTWDLGVSLPHGAGSIRAAGRAEGLDATIGGKADVFPKSSITSLHLIWFVLTLFLAGVCSRWSMVRRLPVGYRARNMTAVSYL